MSNFEEDTVKVTFDQYISFVDLINDFEDEEVADIMKEELKRMRIISSSN